jgi:AcrR family transcriptional regulator
MPRAADPSLPQRVLDAADTLWRQGGEAGVSIRRVAEKAGTTTPTVYSYFADRETLLTALRARAYRRFSAFMAKSTDFRNSCERHLDFAARHGRDYELLYGEGWFRRAAPETRNAEIGVFAAQLVNAGLREDRATETAYAILMMLHGAAMHRLANDGPSPLSRKIRAACIAACETLLHHAGRDASP